MGSLKTGLATLNCYAIKAACRAKQSCGAKIGLTVGCAASLRTRFEAA